MGVPGGDRITGCGSGKLSRVIGQARGRCRRLCNKDSKVGQDEGIGLEGIDKMEEYGRSGQCVWIIDATRRKKDEDVLGGRRRDPR